MEQNFQLKWRGKASERVNKASADQIWPLFIDFFNLHKWFPGLVTCYGIHGSNGELGCIRHCGGLPIASDGSNDENGPQTWMTERLIAIDHVQRSLSYEMVDNNIGFKSYVATVEIFPGENDGQNGCLIEWSFIIDPVEGLVFDDLKNYYDTWLHHMAKRMEDAVLGSLLETASS